MRYLTQWNERLIYRCLCLVLLLCLGATAHGVEKIYYHINDPSGSPVMIVEPDGAVVARYAYAPFGSQVAAQPAAKQRQGYVGGIKETASLHYLKHRYYNPQLGRFYQPDPVGFLSSGTLQINRYAYGLNDPYRYRDPEGRSPLDVVADDDLRGIVVNDAFALYSLAIGDFREAGRRTELSNAIAEKKLTLEWIGELIVGSINPFDYYRDIKKAGVVASTATEGVGFTRSQLQHAFKHAEDFGISGNANNKNLADFSSAIQRHVMAPGTQVIQGSYRGQMVTHFVDPSSGLNVMRDASGNFLSGWRLSAQQLQHVLTSGKLGGGL